MNSLSFRMSQLSLSTLPLRGGDFDDGEIYALDLPSRSTLRQAILSEIWLNMALETQQYWLELMSSSNVRFLGTVVSHVRRQVEITIVFTEAHPIYSGMVAFCISLAAFHRFRGL